MSDVPLSRDSPSSTLLASLRQHDPHAWDRLVHLFGPLVYSRCRRSGLHSADAADVTQEVFRRVASAITRFRRESPHDSFRAWLSVIIRNAIRDFYRRRGQLPATTGGSTNYDRLQALANPVTAPAHDDSSAVESERRLLIRRTLALVQAEFEPATWSAFWRTTIDGATPLAVADELHISVNAVYKAKSRVLKRLREELAELVD